MVAFASAEWVAALGAETRRVSLDERTRPLIVHYVIDDVPAPSTTGAGANRAAASPATLEYCLAFGSTGAVGAHGAPGAGGTCVSLGPPPAASLPDTPVVTFRQGYATAVALATGELAALAAIGDGRLVVSGPVTALLGCRPALAALDAAMAALRAETTYPPPVED